MKRLRSAGIAPDLRRVAAPGRRVAMPLIAIALALAVSGCAKTSKLVKSSASTVVNTITLKPGPMDLNVGIDAGANKNTPVAVDVVLIKDKGFWKSAPSMTAKDWFAQKSDLQRRYRSKLQVASWEWVPDQPIAPITVNVPRWLQGAMVFANYATPGTHSAPLPLGGKIKIALQQEDFTLVAK
jgi:type VI secretion system protein